MSAPPLPLLRLARLYGVQAAYRGADGRRHAASAEALAGVLASLGAPLARPADAAGALAERRAELGRRVCEPVAVAWQGRAGRVPLRLAGGADQPVRCRLELEDGDRRDWSWAPRVAGGAARASGRASWYLPLPRGLPAGYHRLHVCAGADAGHAHLIVAPARAPAPPGRTFGVFMPLYALRSARSWGLGDLGELRELLRWVGALGGGLAGTLPLLAAFLDQPFEPSPYMPVSRLFWNEIYLDLEALPEALAAGDGDGVLARPELAARLAELRRAAAVPYREAAALRRQVLGPLAAALLAGPPGGRVAALRRWARAHPAALDYARFRAATEARGRTWPSWPARQREGRLAPGDWDPAAEGYHLYVQWAAEQQMAEVASAGAAAGAGLYLDLPLGVHAEGYDTWRHRAAFALGASGGAPPDPFQAEGQDWGFPPLHPERARLDGHAYYRACLRHHLRHARALRIDHVMGLHRLWWVPRGMPPGDGAYVRYPARELYAILTLESSRAGSTLVGEDLGTVPAYVRRAMGRHGIRRMYVLPFELAGGEPRPAPGPALACLNTHDLLPFAGWWRTLPEPARRRLTRWLVRRGPVDRAPAGEWEVLRGLLTWLAAGPAEAVMINAEDLWLETRPQNVPGGGDDAGSWRRPARLLWEQWSRRPEVAELFAAVRDARG